MTPLCDRGAIARPAAWFWVLFAFGMAMRLWLAWETRGSDDANIWTEHAAGVAREGLIEHYRLDPDMNHPPFIALVMATLFRISEAMGIEFRQLFRVLFTCIDGINVFLLVRVLAGRPWRWVAAGLYSIAPVAIVLGAMHGNTDVLVATCLLATCLVAGRGSPVETGICIGIGAWIKTPALLAAPIFGFAFPRWRDRFLCTGIAVVVALSTYAVAILDDGAPVAARVFTYHGKLISTLSDPPIWIWGFKSWFLRIFGSSSRDWPAGLVWYCQNSHLLVLPAMIVYAWLRRRAADPLGLAVTVAGCYSLFYGFIETWTFQYLAWSMPFWMAVGLRFGVAANLVAGGYLYALYVHLTDDWMLRGDWRFLARQTWPFAVIALRDIAHAFFVIAAAAFFFRAAREEWRAAAREGSSVS